MAPFAHPMSEMFCPGHRTVAGAKHLNAREILGCNRAKPRSGLAEIACKEMALEQFKFCFLGLPRHGHARMDGRPASLKFQSILAEPSMTFQTDLLARKHRTVHATITINCLICRAVTPVAAIDVVEFFPVLSIGGAFAIHHAFGSVRARCSVFRTTRAMRSIGLVTEGIFLGSQLDP